MGDEDAGNPELFGDALQIGDDLEAEAVVKCRERFVHEEHPGAGQDCPGKGYPLLFSAGEVADPALQKSVELEYGNEFVGGYFTVLFIAPAVAVEEVSRYREMWKECCLLEDEPYPSVAWPEVEVSAAAEEAVAVKENFPLSGCMWPESMWTSVDFPLPDSPKMPIRLSVMSALMLK